MYLHEVQGHLIFHANVIQTANREYLNHYYEVIESLFEQLRSRGIKELETWVREGTEMNFAQMYGFSEFVGEVHIGDKPLVIDSQFYVLKKVL